MTEPGSAMIRSMMSRTAVCTCGALEVEARGEPLKISACHCLSCQRRTGSAFSVAVFYDRDLVALKGTSKTFTRPGDSGQKVEFHFCPNCGTTILWYPEFRPRYAGVAIGCFAGDSPGIPAQAVYEQFRQPWVNLTVEAS
jgi:hypothetical protein